MSKPKNDVKTNSSQKKFVINKKLLPIKFHNFIYFAALASVLPFRTIYAKQLGVSGTEIGITFAVTPFIKILTNPICGAIVDKFKNFRFTLYVILLLVAASHLSLTFIPIRRLAGDNDTVSDATDRIPLFHDDSGTVRYQEVRFRRSNVIAGRKTGNGTRCDVRCDQIVKFEHRNQSSLNCTWHSEEYQVQCGIITTKPVSVIDRNISLRDCDDIIALSITAASPHEDSLFKIRSCLDNATYKCIFNLCSFGDAYISETESRTFDTTTSPSGEHQLQFWMFLLLMAVSNSAFCAVIFLVDVVCYELLDNQPDKYGQQRLWGSIGWGTGSLLAGFFIELFTGDSKTVDYAPCFYLLAVLIIIDLVPLHFVNVENVKYSNNIAKDVARLFQQSDFIFNSIIILSIGVLSGLIWNYEFWYLQELGAGQTLLGLTQTVQCFLSEVPCFFFAGWVCKKIGHGHCNTLALLFFFFRYLTYVPMKNPWLSLPAGLLHGPTFGLFFAAMTALAKEKALPGTEATAQAIFTVIFESIGAAVGNIVGGISLDKLGSKRTFLYAAIFSFCMMVFNVVGLWVFKIKSNKSKAKMLKSKG